VRQFSNICNLQKNTLQNQKLYKINSAEIKLISTNQSHCREICLLKVVYWTDKADADAFLIPSLSTKCNPATSRDSVLRRCTLACSLANWTPSSPSFRVPFSFRVAWLVLSFVLVHLQHKAHNRTLIVY
jgi:hypothetical protein